MEIIHEGKRYVSVSLDEWMGQLQNDHPAREELKQIRLTVIRALEHIDRLEKDNAALHNQLEQARIYVESLRNQTDSAALPGS